MERRQVGLSGSATSRQRNQRGEGSRLREEIIQAAMRLLDSSPAAELSLRMVAREAGVAAPSVYAHFDSAETMMSEIVRECWRQLGEEMSHDARQVEGQGAFARLKAQMTAHVRYAMERPSRYQLLFALQRDVWAWRDQPGPVRPAYLPVHETVERLEADGAKLPMADARSSTILILSIAHGRIALAQLAPHRSGNTSAGVEEFVREALDGLFQRQAP